MLHYDGWKCAIYQKPEEKPEEKKLSIQFCAILNC